MFCMRVFATALLIGLTTAYRPAVDGNLQRPARKFTGEYLQLLQGLCAVVHAMSLLWFCWTSSNYLLQAKFGHFSLLDLAGGAITVTKLTFVTYACRAVVCLYLHAVRGWCKLSLTTAMTPGSGIPDLASRWNPGGEHRGHDGG